MLIIAIGLPDSKGFPWLANDKNYHMILVIIINERDETMLQRTLGSGWGVLLPGLLIAGLMYADLSPDQWRIVILMGLV